MLLKVHGWIPDLLEAQLENLEVLLGQWVQCRDSVDISVKALRALEERIEAHTDVLSMTGFCADREIEEALASEWPNAQMAAAWVILRGGDGAAAQKVWSRFEAQSEDDRGGLLTALRVGAVAPIRSRMRQSMLEAAPALSAAAASIVLCHDRRLPPEFPLRALRLVGEAEVARMAWEMSSYLPADAKDHMPTSSDYGRGLSANSPAVREAAYRCAVLSRQPWVRDTLRKRALADPVALRWLAVLGEPADLSLFERALSQLPLSDAAVRALGSLGFREVLPVLVRVMAGKNRERAAAAGRCFERVTGADVATRGRLPARQQGGAALDDDHDDVVNEPYVADAEAAKAFWEAQGGAYPPHVRLNAGMACETIDEQRIDVRAHWEAIVRRVYAGQAAREAALQDRFPLP